MKSVAAAKVLVAVARPVVASGVSSTAAFAVPALSGWKASVPSLTVMMGDSLDAHEANTFESAASAVRTGAPDGAAIPQVRTVVPSNFFLDVPRAKKMCPMCAPNWMSFEPFRLVAILVPFAKTAFVAPVIR